MVELTSKERARYARHLTLPEFGEAGQLRLKHGSVLIVGAGGLGAPCSLYLTAAGVGTLGIVDFDQVEVSNLQRQVLFDDQHVGHAKATVTVNRLRGLNPGINIREHRVRLDYENVAGLIDDYDVVVDCTDNQATRYLLNEFCHFMGKPLVYGSIFRFEGQISVFNLQDDSPCYRCLFPQAAGQGLAADCSQAGVLGVLPAVIGSIQANEAIKIIANLGQTLSGRLLLYDALSLRFDEIKVGKNPNCEVCGVSANRPRSLEELQQSFKLKAAEESIPSVSVDQLKQQLDGPNTITILDVRQPEECAQNRITDSINIPLDQLSARYAELDKETEIVVHCQAGGRSARACRQLLDLGFTKVKNLDGGMDAWLSVDG